MNREEIRRLTENLIIPDGCEECAHFSKNRCEIGFGRMRHDFEDINFFNVVQGYRGLRNGRNACNHTNCQPMVNREDFCGLVFEHLGKSGLTRQLNRELLKDVIPVIVDCTTISGLNVVLLKGDAVWWSGDALITPHPYTRNKVAGLSGIEVWRYEGSLVVTGNTHWKAPMRYMAVSVENLKQMTFPDDCVESICLTPRGGHSARVRGQLKKIAETITTVKAVYLCDFTATTWKEWGINLNK